jgi:glucose-6-phosphate-specific signal transduction histidine kinase
MTPNPNLKTGPLDQFERAVRGALGVALVLLAWGFGWTDVEAIGALVLGVVALATAAAGFSPADRVLARLDD